MLELYYLETQYMCEYIDKQSVTSMPLLDQLVNQRWLCFLTMDMCCHLMNRTTSLENDVMDKTHPLAQHIDRSVLLLLLSSCQIHIPPTMRLCNFQIPDEYLVCYQMSQHNWVIIKMLYRYLRRCLLGWHRSRLGFLTPSIGEVSLGPLGNAHHDKPCKQWD